MVVCSLVFELHRCKHEIGKSFISEGFLVLPIEYNEVRQEEKSNYEQGNYCNN